MSLYLRIKNDQLVARKKETRNEVAANLLTTLIGEATTEAKNSGYETPSDDQLVAAVRKFIKNLDELLSHSPGNFTAILERSILERYLPKQLTGDEIKAEIAKFDLSNKAAVGLIMKHFKENFFGQYDGKILKGFVDAEIAKSKS